MKNILFGIAALFLLVACNRNRSNDKPDTALEDTILANYTSHKIIPFDVDNADIFRGTFNISDHYFAELRLNTITGKCDIYLNGVLTDSQIGLPESLEDLQFAGLSIRTEDLNNDGFVDFVLTPNVGRFNNSFVHHFDPNTKCFVYKPEGALAEQQDYKTIDNPLGFIVLKDVKYELDSATVVTLLNNDGSMWMTFSYDYEQRLEPSTSIFDHFQDVFPTWKDNFSPWAFKIDYVVLVFKLMKENDDSWDVVVNDETGLVKKLKKDKAFVKQNWSEHLKNVIISFYPTNSKLLVAPNENAEECSFPIGEDNFEGAQVKGDWLKVKSIETEQSGWIRWRKDDKLMIEIFYLM